MASSVSLNSFTDSSRDTTSEDNTAEEGGGGSLEQLLCSISEFSRASLTTYFLLHKKPETQLHKVGLRFKFRVSGGAIDLTLSRGPKKEKSLAGSRFGLDRPKPFDWGRVWNKQGGRQGVFHRVNVSPSQRRILGSHHQIFSGIKLKAERSFGFIMRRNDPNTREVMKFERNIGHFLSFTFINSQHQISFLMESSVTQRGVLNYGLHQCLYANRFLQVFTCVV